MKYATVCSGIDAPALAWDPLGWQQVFASEIEPFPSAVLAHHKPDVPNYGDMTRYKALGNSMAVPVIRWIGKRIQTFESIRDLIKEDEKS